MLELPWRKNRDSDSCVPPAPGGEAIYTLKHRNVPWSQFEYPHLIVEDVPSRSLILYHRGNYYTQTDGCKMPGLSFGDINGDGLIDVRNSQTALEKLVQSVAEGGEKYKVSWVSQRKSLPLKELEVTEPTRIIKNASVL